jgi:hypothetical protein
MGPSLPPAFYQGEIAAIIGRIYPDILIMNTEILSKYHITFQKDAKGNKFSDGKTALSSYLYIWRNIDDIADFLSDINKALEGNFGQISEPFYGDGIIGIYGRLTANQLILSDEDGNNRSYMPLIDFKEILTSWQEFLQQ